MEKTNWIEKIKEAVRVAMNKGLNTKTGTKLPYSIVLDRKLTIYICKECISISTSNGYIHIDHSLTAREELEIQALILTIKEYNEDMAISEFEEFISNKKEDITDINNLDDDN